MNNLLQGYDRWLDAPIERELEARVEDEGDGEDAGWVDDDEFGDY